MTLIEKNTRQKSSWKQHFVINKKLLPLKFTLFFFSASAFSILPYLTIHMKDIGIKVEHIALMYAILPFTIFLGKITIKKIQIVPKSNGSHKHLGKLTIFEVFLEIITLFQT